MTTGFDLSEETLRRLSDDQLVSLLLVNGDQLSRKFTRGNLRPSDTRMGDPEELLHRIHREIARRDQQLPPVEGRPPGSSAEYPLGLGVSDEPHHLVCGACASHFLDIDPSVDRCPLCRDFPGLPPISHRIVGGDLTVVIPGLAMALNGRTLLDVHHPAGSSVDVRPGLFLHLKLSDLQTLVIEPLLAGRTWLHPMAVHRSAVAPITRIWLTHI